MKIVLVLNVQNDYCSEGSIGCEHDDMFIYRINHFMLHSKADYTIGVQEWHPATHISFRRNHVNVQFEDGSIGSGYDIIPFKTITIKNNTTVELDEGRRFLMTDYEQMLHPEHCVQGSVGAEFFNTDLMENASNMLPELNTHCFDMIFRVGTDSNIDCDSALHGNPIPYTLCREGDYEDYKGVMMPLTGLGRFFRRLKEHCERMEPDENSDSYLKPISNALHVHICGMVTEVHVLETVKSLFLLADDKVDINVTVYSNLCAGLNRERHLAAIKELSEMGCHVKEWSTTVQKEWEDPYAVIDPDFVADCVHIVGDEEYIDGFPREY